MIKKSVLFSLLIFMSICTIAQKFWGLMEDPNVPLSVTFEAYLNYVGDRDPYKVSGSKQFFRWYEEAVQIAYPNENLSSFSIAAFDAGFNYRDLVRNNAVQKSGGNWQSYGPSVAPVNGHNGKVVAISFHPTDPDIIFIGGAFGLWRTIDGGVNWFPFSDDYPLTGVSAVEVSPSNPDVVYFLSWGYYDYGGASLGVYKSLDGGDSWNLTNFNYQNTGSIFGRTLKIDPNNEDVVYVSTSEGIYKSNDGLNTYSLINNLSASELELNPGNSSKLYACAKYNSTGTSNFQYSENGGLTWQFSNGLTTSIPYPQFTMALTEADTSVVYVASTGSMGGFGGIFKSTDGGANFVLQSDTPNIFGPIYTGSGGTGGQGAYCMGLACSPVDTNKLFCGGIHLWTSDDGGQTWYSDANIAGTHVDVQKLKFHNGDLWMGNDGGIYKTADGGNSWSYYQNMQTSLIHKIAVSEQEPNDLLTGWQDNGSAYSSGNSWEQVTGGDGFYCFFDYTDNKHRFTSNQFGNVFETTDGISYNQIVSSYGATGVHSQGNFITKIIQNRTDKDNFFIGKDKLYETNGDTLTFPGNWTSSSAIPYTSPFNKINTFDICQMNDDYIYIQSNGDAFRSTDHGQSWTDISSGLDLDSSYLGEIIVSPHDSLHIWVSKSGINEYSKVYESFDGGDSWINITSSGLPNIPINSIEYQKGSQNRIYVSTMSGIYYKDDTQTNWEMFGTGLPNCAVREMTIDYQNGIIYAATYGRGIWHNNVLLDSIPPNAEARAFPQDKCGFGTGEVVYLDLSTGTPTSWEWTFSGGNPSTSSMPSPFVTYPSTGTYTAQLITTNSWGADTIEISLFVENAPIISDFGNILTTALGYSYEWFWEGTSLSNSDSNSIEVNQAGYYHVVVTDSNGCSASSDSLFINLVSVNEYEDDQILFYPNPAGDVLNVVVQENTDLFFELVLTNIYGQIVITPIKLDGKKEIEIGVQQLPKGVYFLNLINRSGSIQRSFKIIIGRG